MKNNSPFITNHSSFAAGAGIPFETKMTELSTTLFAQMKASAELDEVIRQNLKGLGYEE